MFQRLFFYEFGKRRSRQAGRFRRMEGSDRRKAHISAEK
jgi:hypothetical protein